MYASHVRMGPSNVNAPSRRARRSPRLQILYSRVSFSGDVILGPRQTCHRSPGHHRSPDSEAMAALAPSHTRHISRLSARLVARETFGFRPRARVSGAVVGVGVFVSRQRRARSPSCSSTSPTLLTYSSRKRTRLYIFTRVGLVQGDVRTRPASETNRPRSWYYFIDSLTQHACCVSRV